MKKVRTICHCRKRLREEGEGECGRQAHAVVCVVRVGKEGMATCRQWGLKDHTDVWGMGM